jgi:hypothetical protein
MPHRLPMRRARMDTAQTFSASGIRAMNPTKVDRNRLSRLEDLPNIGRAMAGDLRSIGVGAPGDLAGRDPFELYERLCQTAGVRHDPCVLDVFISVVSFMNGGPPLPWWRFTEERKLHVKEWGLSG